MAKVKGNPVIDTRSEAPPDIKEASNRKKHPTYIMPSHKIVK